MKYMVSNEYPHSWKDIPEEKGELGIIYKIMDNFSPPGDDTSGIEDVYVAFDSKHYFRVSQEWYHEDKDDGKGSQMVTNHYFTIIPKDMCQENFTLPL